MFINYLSGEKTLLYIEERWTTSYAPGSIVGNERMEEAGKQMCHKQAMRSSWSEKRFFSRSFSNHSTAIIMLFPPPPFSLNRFYFWEKWNHTGRLNRIFSSQIKYLHIFPKIPAKTELCPFFSSAKSFGKKD